MRRLVAAVHADVHLEELENVLDEGSYDHERVVKFRRGYMEPLMEILARGALKELKHEGRTSGPDGSETDEVRGASQPHGRRGGDG